MKNGLFFSSYQVIALLLCISKEIKLPYFVIYLNKKTLTVFFFILESLTRFYTKLRGLPFWNNKHLKEKRISDKILLSKWCWKLIFADKIVLENELFSTRRRTLDGKVGRIFHILSRLPGRFFISKFYQTDSPYYNNAFYWLNLPVWWIFISKERFLWMMYPRKMRGVTCSRICILY